LPDPRRHRLKALIGVIASVAIALLAAYVLYRTFQRISVRDVLARMREVPAQVLLMSALCAFGAFLALALYEIVVVRHVKRPLGRLKPMLTAFIAFPLGHAIGQAMLSAGAVRYRMYTPAGFSAMEVGATVLLANLPYALAFGLLLDLSLVLGAERLAPLVRVSAHWLVLLGCLGLAKDLGYQLLVRLRKAPIRLGGWAVNLPTPAMTALQLVVGLIDVILISSVLYMLLPESANIGYLPFLAVYLASVLAGVLSHVPAGLGVLESMLLVLLPHVPPDELLAAVLLYRVIYEIVPLLAALALWGVYELAARDGVGLRLWRRNGARRDPADD
jgi:phosphatidylglycerol lysyltransferase